MLAFCFVAVVWVDRSVYATAVTRGGEALRSARKTRHIGLLMLFAAGVYSAFSLSGINSARSEKVFYFLKWKPDYAVVRLYDGMAIAVRFDFKEKAFTQDFFVAKIGDDKRELELTRIVIKEKRSPVMEENF